MLFLIACLLGQFEQTAEHPTIETVRARAEATQKAEFSARRTSLRGQMPTAKEKATLPRTKTQARINEVRKQLAELDKEEKSAGPAATGDLVVNRAKSGQYGTPIQKVVYETPVTINGKRTIRLDESTGPASLTVVATINKTTLLCRCVDKEIVYLNYSGGPHADGDVIMPAGILFVSGIYAYGGSKFITIEPWKHTKEYYKLIETAAVVK